MSRSAEKRAPGLYVLRRDKGCRPFPRTPFSVRAALFLRCAPDRFSLTKANTSCIELPASLRSDGVRDHPGMPFGIPSEGLFSFAGIPTQDADELGDGSNAHRGHALIVGQAVRSALQSRCHHPVLSCGESGVVGCGVLLRRAIAGARWPRWRSPQLCCKARQFPGCRNWDRFLRRLDEWQPSDNVGDLGQVLPGLRHTN